MSAIRVLHIAKANGIGGSERHLFTLLPGLAARGVEVTLCVLTERDADRFVEPLKALGMTVVTRRSGPNENPLMTPVLSGVIRRHRPDLVHTHLLHADLYGLPAARLRGVPAVRSIHRIGGRRGYRTLERLVAPWAEATIAISTEVARFIDEAHLASPSRVRTIPYGIDASPFEAAAGRRKQSRLAVGLAPEEVAVGIASRLVPGKGHGFLIDAVARAQRSCPSIRLLVAGAGPLRDELERQAVRVLAPGVGRFLGHVTDVAGFMAACDVVAFPTLPQFGEGFGLAALEAIASGRPVVATPAGALPELVVEGETGFLVAPGAVGELARSLVRLAEDPALRARLGTGACALARRQFSAGGMIDATYALYREVLAGRERFRPPVVGASLLPGLEERP